jgi:hypothetical protein
VAREAKTDASPPRREDTDASVKEAEASAPVGEPPMAQADVELPEPEPEQAAELVGAVIEALFKEWPASRPPGMKVDDIFRRLSDKHRHPDLGTFGKSTLERAIREAKRRGWTVNRRQSPSDGD